MADWNELDLGGVDAYAAAVKAGYTGTRQQWMTAMQDAEANGLKAEGYANGKQNGTAVESGTYFHDNAQYYKEQAEAAKTAAQAAQAAAETAAETDLVAWLEQNITNPDSPPLDRTLASSSSAAPADMVGDLKSALYFSSNATETGFKRLVHAYIKSGGIIDNVAPAAIGTANDTDVVCYQVHEGNPIDKIVIGAGGSFCAFFTSEPEIGSVSYNNDREQLNTGTYTNKAIPTGCKWIGFRVKTGLDLGEFTMTPYLLSLIETTLRQYSLIGSIDFNEYRTTGFYMQSAVTASQSDHAPVSSLGGWLIVFTNGTSYTTQVYYCNLNATIGQIYVRKASNTTWTDWVRVDSNDGNIVKTIGTLNSGSLNDCKTTGFYVCVEGVSNAPSTGGKLLVLTIGSTTTQIFVGNRLANLGKTYVRVISGTTVRPWVRVDALKKETKVAFFGDSIIWGSIKTVSGDSFVTTQANPTVPDVIAEKLRCVVDNYGVGGSGYIVKATSDNKNIYEKIQATNLTGYTHLLIMAGDNDSSVGAEGIGTYTDTTQNTIMGQMYRIMNYLHENYPSIIPVIIDKNNKISAKAADGHAMVTFGTFPTYYYDYVYPSNQYAIKTLFEETEKFCNYYGVGHIKYTETSLNGWILQTAVGEDGTHYSQTGYELYGSILSSLLTKYIA